MNLSLHGHHQNGSCMKMGSDESHFNVSLTVRDTSIPTSIPPSHPTPLSPSLINLVVSADFKHQVYSPPSNLLKVRVLRMWNQQDVDTRMGEKKRFLIDSNDFGFV